MTITTLAGLLTAIIAIGFLVSLAVSVEKKFTENFPSNLLAIVTAFAVTILAFIAYASYTALTIHLYIIIALIFICVAEAFIAMYGYDKFIQLIKQWKSYKGNEV